MDTLILLATWVVVASFCVAPFFFGMPLFMLSIMVPILVLATLYVISMAREF